MATHPSILAWRIPLTEKPGRLQSIGSHRVGYNCNDLARTSFALKWVSLFFFPCVPPFNLGCHNQTGRKRENVFLPSVV